MPKGPVIISSTTDSEDAAYGLAAGALAARLGASAHIVGPLVGMYRWEGSVRTSREWRVEIRTTADRVAALTVHLKENHTYELPEILATPIEGGSAEYLGWLVGQTR
jgi:periplasmic divalent cation tolerance protein